MSPALDTSQENDGSSTMFLSSIAYDGATARVKGSEYTWDVAGCCQSLLPSFHYLSNKLAFQGLHVALIVVDSSPGLISAWPIDQHTQQFLRKLITRVEIKYSLDPFWVAALENLCVSADIQEAIHIYRESTYLIHRSLLQKDIIYSGNGLTILAVDYVYKFKEQLAILAREDMLPLFREDYKESSIALLRHINEINKDIPVSKPYLRRVYTQFELKEDILEEIFQAYHGKYRYCKMQTSQESPRRIPPLRRTTTDVSDFAVDRIPLGTIHKFKLESPFEYKTHDDCTRLTGIERPRSPKGDLFESSRSNSTTSPKSLIDGCVSQISYSRSSSFPSSNDGSETTKFETASTTSSRRRRLFAPWLKLSRSNLLSSFLKRKLYGQCTQFDTDYSRNFVPTHGPPSSSSALKY